MSHTHIAQKEGSAYTLIKDGNQAFCPKLQPMPQQTQMGGIAWVRFPCNTGCPFAQVSTDNEKAFYNISCEGTKLSLEVAIQGDTIQQAPIIQLS
jgi:sulfatase maturation enzyme AslB (radical SAM superfamily)